MIRNRVAPRQIKQVSEKFYPGMFGRFDDVIEAHIADLLRRKGRYAERAPFYEWLLDEVDTEAYGRAQDRFLAPDLQGYSYLKYLAPVRWFDQKLDFAARLGLAGKPGMRILDIGTGPGHLPMVARYLGHDALGTDISAPPDASDIARLNEDLFAAMARLFKVKRLPHAVLPFQEVTGLPEGFDLVTAFSVNFDHHPDWTVEAWAFFLDSLKRNRVIAPGGSLFMTVIKAWIPPDQWAFLCERARPRAIDDTSIWIDF
jgi:SAM-dependent methyltransferase